MHFLPFPAVHIRSSIPKYTTNMFRKCLLGLELGDGEGPWVPRVLCVVGEQGFTFEKDMKVAKPSA